MIKDTLKGWPVKNVQQTMYSRTFYKTAK